MGGIGQEEKEREREREREGGEGIDQAARGTLDKLHVYTCTMVTHSSLSFMSSLFFTTSSAPAFRLGRAVDTDIQARESSGTYSILAFRLGRAVDTDIQAGENRGTCTCMYTILTLSLGRIQLQYTCTCKLRQGKVNNYARRQLLFFLERKNELPRAGFKPATFCVLGERSTN